MGEWAFKKHYSDVGSVNTNSLCDWACGGHLKKVIRRSPCSQPMFGRNRRLMRISDWLRTNASRESGVSGCGFASQPHMSNTDAGSQNRLFFSNV